jgi:diguanylate cyclase (GGDEF)-like protein
MTTEFRDVARLWAGIVRTYSESRMGSTDKPPKVASVVGPAAGGPLPETSMSEGQIQHAFEHLVDALARFTAIRDSINRIVDFRTEYANDPARAILAASSLPEPGDVLVESLAGHQNRELFDGLCDVVETAEPLVTQVMQYENGKDGGERLVRAYEVRAARAGDGVVVGWRDETEHVLAAAELERRNRELTLVGRLVEYLQSVESSDEVFDVAASFGSQLFESFSGGLFLQNESGSVVEARASWGDSTWGDQVFAPEDCWALRRGQRHGSLEGSVSPRCAHAADGVEALLCVPLLPQGQATGLLVLAASETGALSSTPRSGAASEALAVSVGEHLGLALTNMRLRTSLRDQSIRDPLTGLFNRRYLEETLEREISRSARSDKPFGLMMMDMDHFKEFNDTHGHAAGDALLERFGDLLLTLTRVEDAACRYGGDEFVVLLPESPLEVALLRAEEIRHTANRLNVKHEGTALDAVTLTIGVAAYPDHGGDMAGLVQAADEAMYRAKHAGGNRVEVAATGPRPFHDSPQPKDRWSGSTEGRD